MSGPVPSNPPSPATTALPVVPLKSGKHFKADNLKVQKETIFYNGRAFRVKVTDENGKITNLTNDNELNRIVKILSEAHFHEGKFDLASTIITNEDSDCHVKLNGNEVKVRNQQRVNEIFEKMFKPPVQPGAVHPGAVLKFIEVNESENETPSVNSQPAEKTKDPKKITKEKIQKSKDEDLDKNPRSQAFHPPNAPPSVDETAPPAPPHKQSTVENSPPIGGLPHSAPGNNAKPIPPVPIRTPPASPTDSPRSGITQDDKI